jgi:hypothetical protein
MYNNYSYDTYDTDDVNGICTYDGVLYNDKYNICTCDTCISGKEVAWFQLFYLLGVGGVGNYILLNYETAICQFVLGLIPICMFCIMLIVLCKKKENDGLVLILFDTVTSCLCFPIYVLENTKLMGLWFIAVVLYISGLVWSISDMYYMLL